MLKLITILIGCSLTLAGSVRAAKPDEEKEAAKKQKHVQKQQVGPQHQQQQLKGPKMQVQKVRPEHVNKPMPNNAGPKITKKQIEQTPAVTNEPPPPPLQPKKQKHQFKVSKDQQQQQMVKPPTVTPNNNEQLQANTQRIQKNKLNQQQIQQIQAKHRNFKARRNNSIVSVQFNQNYQIRNAQNWSGSNYHVFRTYRPQWHDRTWWRSHHTRISLIGGGWYFWSGGYWYPAWGYDNSAAYYPYDGPIYSGPGARPFDQVVADVQAVLQEQGYYRGEVDGLLGPLTRQALAEYQSSHGLYVTETIDRPTLNSIGLG